MYTFVSDRNNLIFPDRMIQVEAWAVWRTATLKRTGRATACRDNTGSACTWREAPWSSKEPSKQKVKADFSSFHHSTESDSWTSHNRQTNTQSINAIKLDLLVILVKFSSLWLMLHDQESTGLPLLWLWLACICCCYSLPLFLRIKKEPAEVVQAFD